MNWFRRFERSCAKGALEKAISTAEQHAQAYREKVSELVPPSQPVPDVMMHAMECHDRMVLRLQAMLEKRFPEPRYRRILK